MPQETIIPEENMAEIPAPGETNATRAARMIRVDHAGEVAARNIYAGQLAVLNAHGRGGDAVTVIRDMAEREDAHLETFDRLTRERGVRPTALRPVWDVASFGLGVATALMGERAAMACTAAVEEVIDEHYGHQLDSLGNDDPELHRTLTEFREDEREHRETALDHGAEDTPGYTPLSAVIKAGCRLAIKLSERI